MMEKEKEMTLVEALGLIAASEFKPFTDADWYAFSGCETADPKIAYDEDLGLTIIIDGNTIDFIDDEGESVNILKLITN